MHERRRDTFSWEEMDMFGDRMIARILSLAVREVFSKYLRRCGMSFFHINNILCQVGNSITLFSNSSPISFA